MPTGALDGHVGGRHGRGAEGRAGEVIDESNTCPLASDRSENTPFPPVTTNTQRPFTDNLTSTWKKANPISPPAAAPPASGQHPLPARRAGTPTRAGVAGDRIRRGRRRAATGWQFTLGAGPCAHPVAGMRIKPAHRLPRPPPPDPAAQPRSGRLPTAAPDNHPDGQHRTRCSPRHRRRHAAGRYLLPGDASTNNGDGLSRTQQLRRRRQRHPGCCRGRPP